MEALPKTLAVERGKAREGSEGTTLLRVSERAHKVVLKGEGHGSEKPEFLFTMMVTEFMTSNEESSGSFWWQS